MEWTRLARAQHGLITRQQLETGGLSRTAVQRLLARGSLEPTADQGTFRVAGSPVTAESATWLAVLATRSPLSFRSAADMWDLEVEGDGNVHVTRWDRAKLPWPPGVRVHRVALRPGDVTERHGLPVTTRRETILDCLGSLPLNQARRLADRAEQQGWISADDLERRLADQPGRWGNRQLRRLLTQFGDGAAAESERRMHRLLRSHGIVGWVPNLSVLIDGSRFQIDVAFPHMMLAIEIDGFDYHRRDRFQRDRIRQNALIAAGWTVLRFTWSDIEDRPEYVIDAVCARLAA